MSYNAYETVLYLLSRQNYSEFKLRNKLKQKKFPKEEIDLAIEKAKEKKYFNEESYVRSRIIHSVQKGESTHFIKNRLAQESIEVTKSEIEDLVNDNQLDQFEILKSLINKKLKGEEFKNLPPKKQSSLFNHLLRKGHRFDEIKRAIKDIPIEDYTP